MPASRRNILVTTVTAAVAAAVTAVAVPVASAAGPARPPRPTPPPTVTPTVTPTITPSVGVGPGLAEVSPGAGFRPFAAYTVTTGSQNYTCGGDGAWPGSSTPKATLTRVPFGDTIDHFAGPRWKARDGSTVVGTVKTKVAKSGTIPWLLLDVTAHEGPAGMLSPVTHISRILTSGGLPPAGACTPGQTTSSPYRAMYVFWVAA